MIDFKNGALYKLTKDKNARISDIERILVDGENVLGSYTAMRDYVVFTDKRVISVNVQGMLGKKKDFTSMPYSKISVFSVETAGAFDLDGELEMYFSGVGKVHFEFSGDSDIEAIGKAIGHYVLQ